MQGSGPGNSESIPLIANLMWPCALMTIYANSINCNVILLSTFLVMCSEMARYLRLYDKYNKVVLLDIVAICATY